MFRRKLKYGIGNKRPTNVKKAGFQQNTAPSKSTKHTIICIDSSSSDSSTSSDGESVEVLEEPGEEIEIIKELQVAKEKHRCELCCQGEFLIDRLLRYGGLINETFKFVCDKCDKNFKHMSRMTEHSLLCRGPQFHQNDTSSATKDQEILFCSLCMKSFKSQRGFTQHMKRKHSDLTHTCKICKADFNNFQQFRHHCLEHQKDVKKYECTECDKRFHHRYTLKKHREKKHADVN